MNRQCPACGASPEHQIFSITVRPLNKAAADLADRSRKVEAMYRLMEPGLHKLANNIVNLLKRMEQIERKLMQHIEWHVGKVLDD